MKTILYQKSMQPTDTPNWWRDSREARLGRFSSSTAAPQSYAGSSAGGRAQTKGPGRCRQHIADTLHGRKEHSAGWTFIAFLLSIRRAAPQIIKVTVQPLRSSSLLDEWRWCWHRLLVLGWLLCLWLLKRTAPSSLPAEGNGRRRRKNWIFHQRPFSFNCGAV